MGRIKGEGRITTSVRVSQEFFELAKIHNISFTEALRVGMSIIFAELDIKPYDNNLNLYRKMKFYKSEMESLQERIATLERKNIYNEEIKNKSSLQEVQQDNRS